MREQLEKEIRKRFGSMSGSKERKEMREEIVLNALDRYDEEIGNGASPEDAYERALQSVGDLRELKVNGRSIRIVFFIAICVFAAASLVNMALLSWLIFAFALIGYALLLPALWRLLFGQYRKNCHKVMLIIGILIVANTLILTIFLSILVSSVSDHSEPLPPWTYIDDPAEIESVEFVKYSCQYPTYTEEFEVILTIPEESISNLIMDLKEVNYEAYHAAGGIHDGDRGFLFAFKEGSDVSAYKAFYGMNTIGSIKTDDESGLLDYSGIYAVCKEEDWDRLLDTYVRPYL